MNDSPQDRIRHLVRHAARAGVRRTAARAAADMLRAAGQLTGNDEVDLASILAAAGKSTRPVVKDHSKAWMEPTSWLAGAPLVSLELHCVQAEELAESWVLPAPEACLVAANWALRLALEPDHDDLTGTLDADGPLMLWDGWIELAPAAAGSQPSAWAWNLDPHSRDGGRDLRTRFDGIARDLRGRLDRSSGPVLVERRAGKALTLRQQMRETGWPVGEVDVDPDEPVPDRVSLRVVADVDGEQCVDVWDDAMAGVRAVGEWVARAFGGPGWERDDDLGAPLPGRINFSWLTYHSSLLKDNLAAQA